jgi:Cytochrome c3
LKLRGFVGLAAILAAAPLLAQNGKAPAGPQPVNRCVECHLALDDETLTPPAKAFANDVHARVGFTCAFCHGGDPTQQDEERAHDAKKGFHGAFTPQEIPLLCGKCHSDAAFMKKFNPSLRVDQLSEYRTSKHGQKLFAGDTHVAQCVSCHGAHGILPVNDSRSPVFSANIAQTCNKCHGDAKLMASYGIPSDVYAKYTRSVHYKARMGGDLSAPTCNSCHGNHGATPPEVSSVANVCGTCHAVFAEKFKASPHWEAFLDMGLPGCVTCHGNHEISAPTEAFLGPPPKGVCANCHEAGSKEAQAAAAVMTDIDSLRTETEAARAILKRAAEAGMEVSRHQFELSQADEALTRARADVHFFQPAAVHQDVTEGLKVARAAHKAGEQALVERDYRRRGLFVSLGLILLAIAALTAKIRQLDRRGPPSSPS